MVLCLICEGPTYGLAVSAPLARDGDLGQIWHVKKTLVYRAIGQLDRAGYIRVTGQQPSNHGPVKSLIEATPAGRLASVSWLASPAAHPRDLRSELLIKLALLDRSGTNPVGLLREQQTQLLPIAAALQTRLRETSGFQRTLAMWRHESVSAALRFLEAALADGQSD